MVGRMNIGQQVAAMFSVAVFIGALAMSSSDRLAAAEPNQPRVAAASNEGELAISRIKTPDGMKLSLWAAEPLLANPVAFCIDERGRIFVAETYRQSKGVEDNRGHMDWLDDDLAADTVEDRLAYFRKRLGDKVWDYTTEMGVPKHRPSLPTDSTPFSKGRGRGSWRAGAMSGTPISRICGCCATKMATAKPMRVNRCWRDLACGSRSAGTTCTA